MRGRSVLGSGGKWEANIWETDSIGWDAGEGTWEEVRDGCWDYVLAQSGSEM